MSMMTNVGEPTEHPKISVTEIRDLLRCTQKHAYSYRQGLQSADPPSFFGKGRYLHMLQEAFLHSHVEGEPVTDVNVLSQQVLADMRVLREEGDPAATVAEPDRVEVNGVYADYLAATDMTDIEVVAIEQEVYADVGWVDRNGQRVLLHGFIDALIRDANYDLWLVEHKTAGRAWSQGQFAFDYQTPLYGEAVFQLIGERPVGTLFNFFYPKRWEAKQVYVTPDESALLVQEVQRVIDLRDSGVIVRQPHWGCNDCWFKNLCHAELIGADTQYIRDTQYVVNEDKVARFQEDA